MNDPARLSTMRDRLVSRCTYCGDWRYGKQPCGACGTEHAETSELRRPNVGRRSA